MRWIRPDGLVFDDCAAFFKVRDEFGELSNMAGDFSLSVCGIEVPSSEALYQALRFPEYPQIQREIIAQTSPLAAKMMAKKDRRAQRLTRADWDHICRDVMRWCLRVKLVQNWGDFLDVLMSTRQRPIVERSRKDRHWGAVLYNDGVLRGENWLGRLLCELRDEVVVWLYASDEDEPFPTIQPPKVYGFRLLGQEIGPVSSE